MKKRLLTSLLILGGLVFNEPPASSYMAKRLQEQKIKLEYVYLFEESEKIKELKKKMNDLQNYRTSDFNEDSDSLLLARMILGEAANCSKIEKIAIAYTAIRRANDNKKWNGETIKEAILAPKQYSCFNKDTESSIFLKDPIRYDKEEFRKCLELSKEILAGKYKDTIKATHYYNPNSVRKPVWADKTKKIGKIKVGQTKEGKPILSYHIFYQER